MRGHSQPQPGLILYFDPQSMIPEDEPLRAIRPLAWQRHRRDRPAA